MTETGAPGAWNTYSTNHCDPEFTWGAIEPSLRPPAMHVPGIEVLALRPGRRVLDLGCGTADKAAHVARRGAHVTAIDLSSVQVATAQQRWRHVTNLDMEQAEAIAFMNAAGPVFDAIYSVYGAAWFTDPELLLPAARAALRPHGLFACSHADVPAPKGRVPLASAPHIHRWEYSPQSWRTLLRAAGFRKAKTTVLPATLGFPEWPTILVTARL